MSKQTFHDIQVGDTVWLEDNSPRYSSNSSPRELIEVQVSKVGREYFYSDDLRYVEKKFYKDGGREFVGPNNNGFYAWTAWRHKEEYENHISDQNDRSKLETIFRQHNAFRILTREQVTAILRIVEP